MKRAATTALTPLVRFVETMYGPRALGIDLGLCLIAAGWASLMVAHPEKFDRGTYVGMTWLPDAAWIAVFVLLTIMHGVGAACADWRVLRVAACLLSAWIWLSVTCSIFRVEMTTGVIAYGLFAACALTGAVYLSGQPHKAG